MRAFVLPAFALASSALTCSAAAPGTARTDAPSIWVYFVDKDAAVQTRAATAARATSGLSARALARRARTRGPELVDERDLPVAERYVRELEHLGAQVRVRSRWLNAVSVQGSDASLAAVAALPFVRRVVPLSRRARTTSPPLLTLALDAGMTTEQLVLPGIADLRTCGLVGQGVVVGILDTGFDLSHQAFAGLRVLAQHDFVDDDDQVGPEVGDPPRQAEHGTRTLSLLAGAHPGAFEGAAPGVQVALAKIDDLSVDAPFEDDLWVAGLEWAEALGADIITGSIGFCDTCPPETFDGQTHATSVAAGIAADNGVFVVNSAGNGGPASSTVRAPADSPGVLAIGSVTLERVLAQDSSRGPTWDGRIKPDALAPGAGVWTVDPTSTTSYLRGSGTSFAAPLAAGLASLVLEARPDATASQLRQLLLETADRAALPNNDEGFGLLNGLTAAGGCPAPPDEPDPTAEPPASPDAEVSGGCDCRATAPSGLVLVFVAALTRFGRRAARAHQMRTREPSSR